MKKKIGITYTRTNFDYYPAWFTKEDDVELVILSFEEDNEEDIYQCDGFVLTGGVDIDPSLYGGDDDYPNRPAEFEPDRDAFEAKVYRYAKEKRLPVLGICRGFQLIHVLEGGGLEQDLEELNAFHKSEGKDKQHIIGIAEGSMLHQITGQLSGMVNSAHHQWVGLSSMGIAMSAARVRENAWWKDGDAFIYEGFEQYDRFTDPFLLCVQWHPERMPDKETNPLSYRIREYFIEEVKKTKK